LLKAVKEHLIIGSELIQNGLEYFFSFEVHLHWLEFFRYLRSAAFHQSAKSGSPEIFEKLLGRSVRV
jgi:hypothetical protein